MRLSVQFEDNDEVFSLNIDKSIYVVTLDNYSDWDNNHHFLKTAKTLYLLYEIRQLWDKPPSQEKCHAINKILKRTLIFACAIVKWVCKVRHMPSKETGSVSSNC